MGIYCPTCERESIGSKKEMKRIEFGEENDRTAVTVPVVAHHCVFCDVYFYDDEDKKKIEKAVNEHLAMRRHFGFRDD